MAEEAEKLLRRTYFHLQRGIDYFDFFRHGQIRHWNDRARQPVYMEFPVPYNRAVLPDESISDPDQPIPEHQYVPFRQIRRIDDGSGRTVPEQLRRHIASIGWNMVKVLGAGSQGLAVLFESVRDGKKAVFKWSSEVFNTATEIWAMRQMVGARHIIQVSFHLQPPLIPSSRRRSGR